MAKILRGKPAAESVYSKIRTESGRVLKMLGRPPSLATVLIGDNPASQLYVRKKGTVCTELGFIHRDYHLPNDVPLGTVLTLISDLNSDEEVDGILIQKPLPAHLDDRVIFDAILPSKDVDGFHSNNAGLLSQGRAGFVPCTPLGVSELLRHYGIPVSGKTALVIGRSDIVGKPMAQLLLHQDATVTVAHSKTRDLASVVKDAEIVVCAIGKVAYLGSELPWRSDAVVVDVGIHRAPDGQVLGDVQPAVRELVGAITPVPGGVGPMTIAMLMWNTMLAAKRR
jgi:methylenetetrahydrofolate dehydrogenase (NADP+)/methenyltetrahydrofolate cyclohydrolase